ncbi:GNAT family N-acetyltransferase [Acetobacter orleanensis]|uniref:N-acetyltransferase GCN5 n=1 Tax=Acetobacter orleanensis TaxID=104099 RepID=A0A4Y3TLZ9_9PROT|nr:GNAT family protein [Acetobacter orleanensis]KXV66707.1 GCN5 family acetyltransferase [Acetobacter orleanensis]PCD78684.1 N-acetyltransferase [Acetobacter orleanensis]GAN68856.1 N-acetyltransferase [Acetobacter orleanensis JCM 7639]GBR25683.1 N-acetyltransferase GCN5 [Acetobacter orleanensis NRIC 0473]GEB83386.1 N-acetyltransferase GCN5 [Acetobacter orleanensis]
MERIETERLVLRNFREVDGPALYTYLHDPRASCFFSLKVADQNAAAAEAIKRSVNDEYIAVCLKDTGQLIGDLFAMPEEDTVSVGWNFNLHFAGQGYAFEAAKALFAFLFSVREARRLYAYAEDHNIASQRLCQKLGMRLEGTFIEFISFAKDAQGQPIYENTLQYALLRREWLEAVDNGPELTHIQPG